MENNKKLLDQLPTVDNKRKFFGTDGVRGTVGVAPMIPDTILALAHGAGRVFAQQHIASGHKTRPTVLIGKDTRVSGYMLESLLEAGFTSAGVDVLMAGPLPTPAIAHLARAMRLSAGVVISASHNPYTDNGIKFFNATGHKLTDETELLIENYALQGVQCVSSDALGKAKRVKDAAGRYIEFCKSSIKSNFNLTGKTIVIDAAHGAAYAIAPQVLHELGARVIKIGCEPNGFNINHQVGATHTDALQAAVLLHQADFGIALDGDADRIMMVDSDGRVFDGDELLFVLAQSAIKRGTLNTHYGVVGTLMTNMGFELALKSQGIPFVRAGVGDRYVLEQLHHHNWILGGESSGHILNLEKHTTGDGLMSALQVMEALDYLSQTLSDSVAKFERLPMQLINVRLAVGVNAKQKLNAAKVISIQSQAESALQNNGRVLLRASGTEPVVRVMVEAKSLVDCQHWATTIAETVAHA
jgi:phosphoglucosamine mutase